MHGWRRCSSLRKRCHGGRAQHALRLSESRRDSGLSRRATVQLEKAAVHGACAVCYEPDKVWLSYEQERHEAGLARLCGKLGSTSQQIPELQGCHVG
eukprot:scaffold12592_cov23-Tisochrysis_lutea.AAC.1